MSILTLFYHTFAYKEGLMEIVHSFIRATFEKLIFMNIFNHVYSTEQIQNNYFNFKNCLFVLR